MTSGIILSAMIAPAKMVGDWPDKGYLRVRADRAIVANLLATNAVLQTQLAALSIVRRSIRLGAVQIDEQDANGWQRLGSCVGDYYRAHGRLQQGYQRLGRRLDRMLIASV